MSQKKEYMRSVADKDAKCWCGSCNLDRRLYSVAEDDTRLRRSSFETTSGSERILFRRPRLVRGLYLGKEPLEYRKRPTPFRFSFQKTNKDNTNKENESVENFKRKIIYPKSINVRLCTLQTRPMKCGEYKQDSSERKSVAVGISNILAGEVNNRVPLFDQQQKKQVPLLSGKEAKLTEDSKEADKARRNGKIPRQLQEKGPVNSEKSGMLRSDYLKRKNKDSEQYRTGPYHVEELTERTGKISVEYYLEYFKFKLSDYDIWSRTSNAC